MYNYQVEDCEIAEESEFDSTNYAPSPDGLFTLTLMDSGTLDMKRFKKLKIKIHGTYIVFKEKKREEPKYGFLNFLHNYWKNINKTEI